MNKKVIASVFFMVVVNLVAIFYINHKMLGMQKTVNEMKGLAIKLPPSLESELEGKLNGLVEDVKSSTDNAVASVTTDVNRIVVDMKDNVVDAKKTTKNAFDDVTQMMQSAILDASSNIVEMCRSKVLGNELEAARSYQKAVQVLNDGDFALAKLYCMNAINHSPTQKLYFEKLLEISTKAGDETRDDLEQIKVRWNLGFFRWRQTM